MLRDRNIQTKSQFYRIAITRNLGTVQQNLPKPIFTKCTNVVIKMSEEDVLVVCAGWKEQCFVNKTRYVVWVVMWSLVYTLKESIDVMSGSVIDILSKIKYA